MSKVTILALRIVLSMALAGSLFVQAVMVPLLFVDLTEEGGDLEAVRAPIVVIVLVGIMTTQVVMVCLWRLLTMVRHGIVFTRGAFRWVDVISGAVGLASVLTFALGCVLAPGEAVAPGIVLLVGGVAVVLAGIALVIVVMRALLAQAVARDAEARHLQTELDEVI